MLVQTALPVHICVSVVQSGIDFRQNIDKIMKFPSFFDTFFFAFFFLRQCVIAQYFVLIDLQPEVKMSL